VLWINVLKVSASVKPSRLKSFLLMQQLVLSHLDLAMALAPQVRKVTDDGQFGAYAVPLLW
jgi:hypothetical protein